MNIEVPLLSVIVPVYKVEKYIGRCLDSIISQTFTNWECIIIDDGSPDKSGKICDEYAKHDHRFRVIHKKNEGVGKARNEGIMNAKGRFLTFIDSDDTVNPKTFENYIKYIDQCDWVFVGVKKVDLNLKPLKEVSEISQLIVSEEDNYEDVLIKATSIWMMFGPIWNKIYHTDIIRKNNIFFTSSTNVNDDRIFNLHYATHTKRVVLSPYIGYNYVTNPNSITKTRIKSATFLNSALEIDHALQTNLFGKNMQKYTATFAIRFFTRAFITGFVSPTNNRWKETKIAIQSYIQSTSYKKYGVRTLGWSLSYIFNGIKRKISLQK